MFKVALAALAVASSAGAQTQPATLAPPTGNAQRGKVLYETTLRCYAHGAREFAGVELGRVFLKADPASTRAYYGRERRTKEVLSQRVDVRSQPTTFPTAVTSSFNWAHAAFYPPPDAP